MLIARCAWHAFFRGYPRPLRVISWRGRGVSFSDTICPSCAERVRIERLWGIAPPTPVWPGAAHTALIFVGVPLLTALVLLATPLHDAPPPRPDEAAAPLGINAAATEPRGETGPAATSRAETAAAMPRAAATPRAAARRPAADDVDVPAVIYETRRARQPVRGGVSSSPRTGSAPAILATPPGESGMRPLRTASRITLATASVSAEPSAPPQSP